MPNKAPVAEPIEKEEASCKHYWVIQAATGPVSPGVCQTCGETREFKNYVEASTWGEDKSASRQKAAVVRPPADEVSEDDE